MKSGVAAVVVGVAIMAPAVSAQSTGKTANLKVTANVVQNCILNVTDVNFGTYDPVGANASTPKTANGTVELSCTPGTVATIGLANGQNAQGTTRRMAGPATNMMSYELFKDAALGQPWGNAGAAALALPAAPNTAKRAYTVYGRVPAAQNVAAGSYNDVVVVTVSF